MKFSVSAAATRLLAWAFIVPATLAVAAPPIDFNREIRPLLSNRCFRCHGPDGSERQGGQGDGLRLDTRDGATADLGGQRAIVPNQADDSALVRRITATDANERMPPPDAGPALTAAEIELIRRWIDGGAAYANHWSYVAAVRPPLPAVRETAWPVQLLDRFVLAELERQSRHPSPLADRRTLIRRVTQDLIGLPPTVEQVEQFLADERPDAYERLVDRLLQDVAFGEHWARAWLDLARYADSAGYADDPPRKIWLYRDYVIRAFNDDKPFSAFTIEQLAGDLLPHPTDEQLIATAFHRNTLTNNEGGTNDEEYRNVAIVDRVNTTMAVWMGTTMACAQCHNHKYDPLSQTDFFRLFAVFNNTEDADRGDEAPVHSLYSVQQLSRRRALQERIEQRKAMPHTGDAEAEAKELAALEAELQSIQPDTVPIQRERPAESRRETRVQRRGNFLDVGDSVAPGTPGAFPPLPADVAPDRLAVARWLVDPQNPLTSRVLANRCWEQMFGTGIVVTSEDFGAQGELPSHPELLDWLACELISTDWDLKALLRQLVTSATYRQTSQVDEAAVQADPENRWLARGPRFRLSAEMIRDQALAASGLLSRQMFGPPVRPWQPALGVNAAFGSGIDWTVSDGDDRYRRGIYTTWRRSNPYPSLSTFDAPNREVCTLKRSRTNTPLQALVTLNDPVFIEAAQALARRVATPAHPSFADRLDATFLAVLARRPDDAEKERLQTLHTDLHTAYHGDDAAARKMATDPLGPLPPEDDPVELACWTVIANVVLNLDEALMKP